MEIKRDKYLADLVTRMGNGMVKVVTGIRRCGKTYLIFTLFGRHLRESGVDNHHIIELALDDRKNARYRDPDELYNYLEDRIGNDSETYYVLLDEIQYAIGSDELKNRDAPPALYEVLNGLLRKRNVDVYVTGSNSKLLSQDIMTQFRGRGDVVHVMPLSFAEFMQAFPGDRYEGWAEYITYGGMPLLLSKRTDEQKARYLEELFREVYLVDLVERHGIEKTAEFDDLINILASAVGSLSNPSKIEATFKSVVQSKVDANTIKRWIGYLEEAYLISEAQRYNVKGRKYIGTPKKYYFEDVGLRNARLGFRQVEETHLMENVIYNELRMRGYSVDVGVVETRSRIEGKDTRIQREVDFVANLGSKRYYIQSAFRMDGPEKIAQEKASLLGIDDSFKKIIVVKDVVKPHMDESGILTMGVFDFLLNPNSLSM